MTIRRNYKCSFAAAFLLLLAFSCTREIDELELATFPPIAEVFIDGFSGGLSYAAFAGSKVTAFQVDNDIRYQGAASMRFEVPDADDPEGGYAGGSFTVEGGRDLSGYNALTFWARASQPATIDEIGFGSASEGSTVTVFGLNVNSNWQQYIIPIPDPSLLTQERGMLFFSEPPEEGRGYTFWLDEVKFEQLEGISNPRPAIWESLDEIVSAETGDRVTIGGLTMTSNLPTGVDLTTAIGPAYLTFFSSDPSVATVDGLGVATVLDAGETVVTAELGELDAAGSLTIQSSGAPILPAGPAPTPSISPDSVISMFSNAYTNVTVDTYNPFWEFSTAEVSDVQIGQDDVKRYKGLNFVGILTETEPIDATEMTHFHMDIWTPDPIGPTTTFKILLVDFGANGIFGGGDDSSHELSFTSPTLTSESWISLDIPLTDFVGLTNRAQIAQLVLSGDVPNVFVDNLYYYSGEVTSGGPTEPSQPAPDPMQAAADVVSLFSDAYMDVAVDTWRTDWSAADFEDVTVQGNATKKYSNLDFVGIETVANTVDATGMTHLHLDVWSADYTFFGIKLVDFGADGAFGGGDDVEHQINFETPVQGAWVGLDIPLSDFAGLTTRGNIAQYILTGQPTGATTVYVDNVYFYNEGGSMATEPSQPAPDPMQAAADVVSLFSDAYMDVAVDTWRTDWSAADFEDVTVQGNATKKYSNLDFVGIETVANTVDATGMTHLHLDVWSADYTFFGIKLVDFGADGAFGGGDDVEHQINFETPVQGAWVGLDIPLNDFAGLTTRGNIAQYILVGQPTGATTIYVDNIYFYK